jgi:hypothetical protein
MRLNIDFSALEDLVRRMGATFVQWRVDNVLSDRSPIPTPEIKSGEISIDELDVKDDLLSVSGKQVIVYIQDHESRFLATMQNPETGYKFHVANCRKLQDMKNRNMYSDRYHYVTDLYEDDGNFEIIGKNYRTGEIMLGMARLRVCQYCLDLLNYQGFRYQMPPIEKKAIVERFSPKEFFETYRAKFLPPTEL